MRLEKDTAGVGILRAPQGSSPEPIPLGSCTGPSEAGSWGSAPGRAWDAGSPARGQYC